jgi:anti-sigma regulatory factor (Ser/Thr protein kinase)
LIARSLPISQERRPGYLARWSCHRAWPQVEPCPGQSWERAPGKASAGRWSSRRPRAHLRVQSSAQLAGFLTELCELLIELGLSEDERETIVLATSEAASNALQVCRVSGSPVRVAVTLAAASVCVEMRDASKGRRGTLVRMMRRWGARGGRTGAAGLLTAPPTGLLTVDAGRPRAGRRAALQRTRGRRRADPRRPPAGNGRATAALSHRDAPRPTPPRRGAPH